MKQFHYVYITTNLIDGKQYVGDHSTDNLDDGYLGSGRPYFQHAIKKYGKHNFKKEILEHFNNKEEAFLAQEKYIKQFNTLNPNGYNISPTGGLHVRGCLNHSEETKIKMSIAKKGKIPWNKGIPMNNETKNKISIVNKGKKPTKESRIKQSNAQIGKKHTFETKEKIKKIRENYCYNSKKTLIELYGEEKALEIKNKMSKSSKGNKNCLGNKLSDEHKKNISNSLKGISKNNGRKLSEETKKKISESMKKRNEYIIKIN